MITLKKINNHVVKPIEVNHVDPDKIKGYDLIPKLFCTIFVCAKKESGKTNAIFKILKECSNKKLNYILFQVQFLMTKIGIKFVNILKRKEMISSNTHP